MGWYIKLINKDVKRKIKVCLIALKCPYFRTKNTQIRQIQFQAIESILIVTDNDVDILNHTIY